MRVLHVLDSFSFGGAENLVVELARHAPEGMDLRVASLGPSGRGRDDLYARMATVGLRPSYLGVRRLADPAGLVRLVRALRELRPDVIHAHLGYSATVVPVAARIAGIGCVATLHHVPEDLPVRDRLKERWSVRAPAKFGRLVLVSTASFREFERRYGPATPNWRLVPNGVDLTRYRPVPGGSRLPSGAWACVAALREPKGHVDLLQAWRMLCDRGPQPTLLIVGDGPRRLAIQDEISRLKLAGQVQLLGRREDVPELLAMVDGVVSASHTEALPTALIEAGAAGLPVVTTAAGGSTDVVTQQTGWLTPPRDVAALADALFDAVTHPEEAARRGSLARERVTELFSMAAWTDRLLDLYREVMPTQTAPSTQKDDPCRTTSTK